MYKNTLSLLENILNLKGPCSRLRRKLAGEESTWRWGDRQVGHGLTAQRKHCGVVLLDARCCTLIFLFYTCFGFNCCNPWYMFECLTIPQAHTRGRYTTNNSHPLCPVQCLYCCSLIETASWQLRDELYYLTLVNCCHYEFHKRKRGN